MGGGRKRRLQNELERDIFAQISQNPKNLQKYNNIIPMHIPNKVVQ